MSRAIENEVWDYAPTDLTQSSFILLLVFADAAGQDHRMAWLGAKGLQKKARMSRRNVFYSLAQLKNLGVLEDVPKAEWPPEAHLYDSVVRRIRPREVWGIEPEPDPEPDPEPGPLRYVRPGGAGDAPRKTVTRKRRESDVIPTVQVVPPIKDAVTRSTGGVQRVHPNQSSFRTLEEPTVLPSHRSRRDVESTPHRGSTKRQEAQRKAAADADLDPATILGISTEPEPPAPTRTRRKRPGTDTGMGLALAFQDAVRNSTVPFTSPSPVNLKALAKNFSGWMRDGVDNQLILSAINAYVADPGLRNTRKVPWVDFLAHRSLLLDRARTEVEAEAAENDPNYWKYSREEEDHPGLHDRDYWYVPAAQAG